MSFPAPQHEVPWISTEQMVEVDRAMIEDYGISLEQMMENAGRGLALVARKRFLGDPTGKTVTVLAGPGGNGGGALACARRLHTWGALVSVDLAKEASEIEGVPAQQLASLQALNVPVASAVPKNKPALIIDGLIGYSLSGDPRGRAAELIHWANEEVAPVLALDVPSGLDSSTGEAHRPTVRAAATLTLALPKQGLRHADAHVGELYLADISVPPQLYARSPLNLQVGPLFAQSDILRLGRA